MKILSPILVVINLLVACNTTQPDGMKNNTKKEHSLTNELLSFLDINSLPEYLDSTTCAQVSTWDTTGGNNDGFNGTYSFLRRNADSSLVIFDQQGSGVINRIWTPTPTEDTLDFFIDDNRKPAFSIQYMDLFSGKSYPFIAPLCGNQLGGFYCYMPIPFEKSCKIVSRGKIMQFHQIQYRLYENGAKVKSFDPDLNSEEKEVLEKIASLWNKKNRNIQDYYSETLLESSEQFNIEPGKTITAFELHKEGRILGIEFDPVNVFEGTAKNIDIRITWDNEKSPAVFCPASDFFGYAFGKASMQSLLIGSADNRNYCYFPMPFDKEARIELVYRKDGSTSQNPLQVSSRIWYTLQKRDPDKEGKFYAHWNKNIKPQSGHPHVFLDFNGKGQYVGTILQAQGLQPGMTYFFEGDDSAAIDGSFRIHGTGSEDYFNGGWYALMDRWDGRMSLPLHGALDYSIPLCRTGGYRLYIADKLSFETSVFHSIEHGPVGNKFPVDYTSVALYYSDTPVKEFTEPTNELTEVYIPDTLFIYPQLMDYNISGNMDVKTTWKYGTGGENYLFTPGDDASIRISLADIPLDKYSVYFDAMKEPFGCDFSLWQRQTRISEWMPTYQSVEKRAMELYVCDIELNGIINTMTIRFKTDQQKKSLLLNRIILIRNK